MPSTVCPNCATEFNVNRFYTPQQLAAELQISLDTLNGWCNQKGLVFRVRYMGRGGRVRRLFEWKRVEEFLAREWPEFSETSEHKACLIWKWRRDNGRKGQAASVKVRLANKAKRLEYGTADMDHGAMVAEPPASTDDDSSSPSDPQA